MQKSLASQKILNFILLKINSILKHSLILFFFVILSIIFIYLCYLFCMYLLVLLHLVDY